MREISIPSPLRCETVASSMLVTLSGRVFQLEETTSHQQWGNKNISLSLNGKSRYEGFHSWWVQWLCITVFALPSSARGPFSQLLHGTKVAVPDLYTTYHLPHPKEANSPHVFPSSRERKLPQSPPRLLLNSVGKNWVTFPGTHCLRDWKRSTQHVQPL